MKSSRREVLPNLVAKFRSLTRMGEFGVFISLLCVASIFALLSKEFLTPSTWAGILTVASEIGIISVGVSFLMISGEFDLSVSSVFAVSGMTMALLSNLGIDPSLAFLIAMLLSACIGAVNGLITLRFSLPSFITTLGMMMFLRGVLLAVTGGFPIEMAGEPMILHTLSGRMLAGFRSSALWFIIFVLIFQIVLGLTPYGNWTYATGNNAIFARASGVNARKVKFINFILSATLAGFSGCIALARFRIVEPLAGTGLELEAIAASVIGGCSLSGGVGSIIGAGLGALLVGMIRIGLVLAGAPPYWYRGFIGVILVAAAIIYRLTRRR